MRTPTKRTPNLQKQPPGKQLRFPARCVATFVGGVWSRVWPSPPRLTDA